MKKFLVLLSFVVLAAACATEPAGNNNMTANTNKAGETKTAAGPSEADLQAKETAAWDAFKRKDADAFKKSLASEYFGVSATGVGDTAASIAAMKDSDLTDLDRKS